MPFLLLGAGAGDPHRAAADRRDARARRAAARADREQHPDAARSNYVPIGAVREYLRNGVHVPTRATSFGYVKQRGDGRSASFIAVLFMIVYMLIDAHRLRNIFLLFYPPETCAANGG